MDKLKIEFNKIFKKHGIKILIAVAVIVFILLLNYLLRISVNEKPITTKDPFATVLDPSKKFPTRITVESNSLLNSFGKLCSEGKVEEAYNLLSIDCKRTVFHNSIDEFKKYAKANFPKDSRFEIIPYSKVGSTYVYQVKVFEDFLATGLTHSDYSYIDLKVAINEDKLGRKILSVAGFMGRFPLDSVFENDYLKLELKEVTSFYPEEIYKVSITNRTENDIVIKDNKVKGNEIFMDNSGDLRYDIGHPENIILKPYETRELNLKFARFFDEQGRPGSIVMPAIRVVKKNRAENYTNSDIIAKFSISADITR